MSVVLGFDTSGPHCGVALYQGDDLYHGPAVTSALYEDMVKGQAERLMPMIEEVMADAKMDYSALTRIGVGVGPGNFTGIRIAVSAARGLATALGIPAIGVNLFDALAFGSDLPILASLRAPRDQFYIREQHADGTSPIAQLALADIPAPQHSNCICIGADSAQIAAHLGLTNAPAAFAPASAIARIAAMSPDPGDQRPSLLYLRPADAAPPRDPAPMILP